MVWSDVEEVAIYILWCALHRATSNKHYRRSRAIIMQWNASGGSSDQILKMITSGQ